MRILGVEPGPAFSVFDCHQGWMRAFQNAGHDVASFNLGDRLNLYAGAHMKKGRRYIKACSSIDVVNLVAKSLHACVFEFMPDVVFLTSGFFVPNDTMDLLRARGIKVVLLHTEAPYEQDAQLERAAHADVNLVNDNIDIDLYPRAAYQWHCYDPAVHYRRAANPEYTSEFVFCGTAYPSRIAFFEQVDFTGIDVALAGNWSRLHKDSPLRKYVAHDIEQCLDNDQAVDLYSNTKVSANIYRVEAETPEHSHGWAMGPREVELAAIGVPFLRQSRGEGDAVLSMLPTFDSPDSFGEQLRVLIGDEQGRREVAAAAQAAVADRTFDNAAQRLLTLL